MTRSALTNGVQLTSDSSPRPSRVDRFIVHHAATTSLAAILSLFQPGGRTVSANYALGNDGTLILAVDEDRRAWTSASASWDGRAITIEVANSVAGDPWPVSAKSFDKLARLIADVSLRYGFPINDDTVLTHQELYLRYGASYATACPGDMQRRKRELITLANKYRAAGPAGIGGAVPIEEEIEVIHYHNEDRRARALEPGESTQLKDAAGGDANVTNAIGVYSITPHVYAEGLPGDELEVLLLWYPGGFKAGKPSPHYVGRFQIGGNVEDENAGTVTPRGLLRAHPEFKRAVRKGEAVALRVQAPSTNRGPVNVTVIDCDAFAFNA